MTYQEVNVHKYLTDSELHQIMEIVGKALDKASSKGSITGDTSNLELSITANIPQ